MLLNHVEFVLMNNPVRSWIQRRVEARRLLQMGGRMNGGLALELGCGRGVGTTLILGMFGADAVDAFDLDPRMITLARRRLAERCPKTRVWVGDATVIAARDSTYDAVFDFGIIHHVPEWRRVLREVERVLKPGGRFYGEEVLARLIQHPIMRFLLDHPQAERFDTKEFIAALRDAGLIPEAAHEWREVFAWFTAVKPSR